MFAGGVGRIFSEFDSFLQVSKKPKAASEESKRSPEKNASPAPAKKNKKLFRLLENFFDETSCLLNIDRSEYEKGNLPWGLIFYNRMLSAQTLISPDQGALYEEAFQDYLDYYSAKQKKRAKKGERKRTYLNNCRALLLHLQLHQIDLDSVLVGLSPSKTITERFNEWLTSGGEKKHAEEAQKLAQSAPHPLSLYLFGFPARRGDLVVTRVSPSLLKNKIELRDKVGSALKSPDHEDGVLVFGRVSDAVQCNKSTFIELYLTPKEEETVSMPPQEVAPLRYLMPPGTSWMGKVSATRDMVADPYDEFLASVRYQMRHRLDEMLRSHGLEVLELDRALQQRPVSFLYYHTMRNAAPILSELANGNGDNMEVAQLRAQFIKEWTDLSKKELDMFIEAINSQDGSSNKLFIPTCEQDLMRLNRLSFPTLAADFLSKLSADVKSAIEALDSDRGELMNGNLKNQLSKWWLLLIKTKYEMVLGETAYDASAWDEDSYIDQPPNDIDGVKANLAVVQRLIDGNDGMHAYVTSITEDVKKEVYPVIDDFIMKAHIILYSELLDVPFTGDYSAEKFDLVYLNEVFQEKKNDIAAQYGEEQVKEYDGLMKDLKYLVEMKKLEEQSQAARDSKASAKLELSYAVPLSGLVLGCFLRLENVLKTVIELWGHIKPVQTDIPQGDMSQSLSRAQSTQSLEGLRPSDRAARPVKKDRPRTLVSFGTVSPSRRVPPERRNTTIIGSLRQKAV